MEHLVIALQVHNDEGREPYFSLDPVDSPSYHVKPMTSVGGVFLQVDHHLKGLPASEDDQVVVIV